MKRLKDIGSVLKADFGIFFLLLLLAAGLCRVYQDGREQRIQEGIAEKVLRFHVRANSDSAEDQALKLKVRDAVGAYMRERLKDADSLSECRETVREDLEGIAGAAQAAVRAEGFAYAVAVRLEETAFPEKTYGAYTFPAGEYQALNVVIGSGRGHNWWCVMYPNICFSGSVYKVEDKKAGEALRRALTEEEYSAVLKSGDYRIRFKYLDFLNRWFG